MKELVINQPSKNIVRMIQKIVGRANSEHLKDITNKITGKDLEEKMYYEILQKGTYTCCILTIDNEIVGLGITKRERSDKYNARVAGDVCVHKAIKDWLFGIKPEYENLKEAKELRKDIKRMKELENKECYEQKNV